MKKVASTTTPHKISSSRLSKPQHNSQISNKKNVNIGCDIVKIIQSTHQIIFQMEIDYQIAKILQTLDGKQLNHLKQTIKNNSNLQHQLLLDYLQNQNKQQKQQISQQIQQQIIIQPQISPQKQLIKLQKFDNKKTILLKPFIIKSNNKQDIKKQSIKSNQKIIQNQQIIKQQDKLLKSSVILQKINHLTSKKKKQLLIIIDQLEKSQKIDLSSHHHQLSTQNPINQSNFTLKQSTFKINKSQIKKKQSSLHNSIIKNRDLSNSKISNSKINIIQKQTKKQDDTQIQQQITIDEINDDDKKKIPSATDEHLLKPPSIQPSQEQVQKLQLNSFTPNRYSEACLRKKSKILNIFPTSIKKQQQLDQTQSYQKQIHEISQSKMFRVGKKKLGKNQIKIILINNNEYSSIITLTSIQFFNINGKIIPIILQNIKSNHNLKLIKLFNGYYKGNTQQEVFSTVVQNHYQIQLEIPQKISGIKIWNYNKSQIQYAKANNSIQIYINDKLSWKGQIKKQQTHEPNNCCTQVDIEQGFFNNLRKQQKNNLTIIKKQQNYTQSIQKINKRQKSQGHPLSSLQKYTQKQKKVNWFQNKIPQIKQQKKDIKIVQQQKKDKQKKKLHQCRSSVSKFSKICEQKINKNQNQNQQLLQLSSILSLNKVNRQNISKQQPANKQLLQYLIAESKQKNASKKYQNIQIPRQSIDQKSLQFPVYNQKIKRQKTISNQLLLKNSPILQKLTNSKQNLLSPVKIPIGYQSIIFKQDVIPKKFNTFKQISPNKNQKSLQSFQCFINDSIFQQTKKKTQRQKYQKIKYDIRNQQKIQLKISQKLQQKISQKKIPQKQKINQNISNNQKKNNHQSDFQDLLKSLNNLVDNHNSQYRNTLQKNKQIVIPQLPKGIKMQINFISNWGDSQYIGLNKIQFFDSQGKRVQPIQAKSNVQTSSILSFFKKTNQSINNSKNQWKCQKKQPIKLFLTFSKKTQFSFIRFWNYIGDRVHSMCGIKHIQIFLDQIIIFFGDIKKNIGNTYQQILQSYQSILFTNNSVIHSKIIQNDWLTSQLLSLKQQHVMFKKTSENFMRPLTNGLQHQKNVKLLQKKQPVKLPKRNCFQYDPPTLPSGWYLKLTLHTTWGDRDFIGLNGISIYDEKCNQIKDLKKISQFPAPLITFPGYEKDKRILANLFDGNNLYNYDQNIWLTTLVTDVDKIQKLGQNSILIQFQQITTISAINIYNYLKTPQRGVRQISIYIDQYLIYKGYLRIANQQTGQLMTTINFTKQQSILQKIGYLGYHQDNIGQNVCFYNQGQLEISNINK